MARHIATVAFLLVFVSVFARCTERGKARPSQDVGGHQVAVPWTQVEAHQSYRERERALGWAASTSPKGSLPRVEALLRLVDLRLEQASDLRSAAYSGESTTECAPERVIIPSDDVRALYESALSTVAVLRNEVPETSDARPLVEWRAALVSRGLAQNSETREALLTVIRRYAESPLVPEALLAFGDTLWTFAGDEYKMCSAYRRASERESSGVHSYALLQLGRCAFMYGDTEGARRELEAAASSRPGPTPVYWRCHDLNRAATAELLQLTAGPQPPP